MIELISYAAIAILSLRFQKTSFVFEDDLHCDENLSIIKEEILS